MVRLRTDRAMDCNAGIFMNPLLVNEFAQHVGGKCVKAIPIVSKMGMSGNVEA
jgi:hypothetical protein